MKEPLRLRIHLDQRREPDGSLRLRAVLPRSGTTPISAASDRKRSVIPDLVDPVTADEEFLQHPHNLLSWLREETPA
jgi:hypothetical protein